jgi:hypothetical protein
MAFSFLSPILPSLNTRETELSSCDTLVNKSSIIMCHGRDLLSYVGIYDVPSYLQAVKGKAGRGDEEKVSNKYKQFNITFGC